MEFLGDAFEVLGIKDMVNLIKVLTPYGQRVKSSCLLNLKNLNRDTLVADFDVLDAFVNALSRDKHAFSEVRQRLNHVKDLTTTFKNIEEGVTLVQTELYEVKCLLLHIKALKGLMAQMTQDLPPAMHIGFADQAYSLLDPQGFELETFYIDDAYSEDLKAIRAELNLVESQIKQAMTAHARALLKDYQDIRIKPNGTFVVREDHAHYQALKEDPRVLVKEAHYNHVTFGLLLANQDQALKLKREHLLLQEEEATYAVRARLTLHLQPYLPQLLGDVEALGLIDYYLAKAFLAIGVNGTRPTFTEPGSDMVLKEGRHYFVEAKLKAMKKVYTPISVRFNTPVTLVRGANMGGKTIALKMVGLLVGMAHMGLYVPAQRLSLPVMDYIATVIGDDQSVDQGLSTFGAEMVHVKSALSWCQKPGLILMDELSRGTNPIEGAALSDSIIDHLTSGQAITMITTHYEGIGQHDLVKHMQVKGLKTLPGSQLDEVGIATLSESMDYRLIEVDKDAKVPHDALTIASYLGIDRKIIDQARIKMRQGYGFKRGGTREE